MPETGTSGLISGERKRSAGSQSKSQATAPLLDSYQTMSHRHSRTRFAPAGMGVVSCRQAVVTSAAFAAGIFIARHPSFGASDNPFTLGVASGEPSPDGFVLWTRLARSQDRVA